MFFGEVLVDRVVLKIQSSFDEKVRGDFEVRLARGVLLSFANFKTHADDAYVQSLQMNSAENQSIK